MQLCKSPDGRSVVLNNRPSLSTTKQWHLLRVYQVFIQWILDLIPLLLKFITFVIKESFANYYLQLTSIIDIINEIAITSWIFPRLMLGFYLFFLVLLLIQPYCMLLKKLSHLTASPCIIKWFHSFLISKTQNIQINSTLSSLDPSVVPQSCVSSALFTL